MIPKISMVKMFLFYGTLLILTSATGAQDCTIFSTLDCLGCLNNTEGLVCGWTSGGGCFNSCDDDATAGEECYSNEFAVKNGDDNGNLSPLDAAVDICELALDAQICISATDCISCTNLMQSDGLTSCQWYIDHTTKTKGCHVAIEEVGGGAEGYDTCDTDVGTEDYIVGISSPLTSGGGIGIDGPEGSTTSPSTESTNSAASESLGPVIVAAMAMLVASNLLEVM